MKKLILTILFLVLSGLTIYYIIYKKGSTLKKTEKLFALNDSRIINRIELVKGNQKVIMIRETEYWSINGKETRTDLVNTMIGVSEGLDAIAPVPRHHIDSVLKHLDSGTKITFFKDDKVLNSFTLCKWNLVLYGIRENYENPYKITLRGFSDIDLTKIYDTNENYWLTNFLIDVEPENIKSIDLRYPANPEMGFSMQKSEEGIFTIYRIVINKELTNTDTEIISEYLYFFSKIRYFPVDDTTGLRVDIIGVQEPFFHLKIQNLNGEIVEISGYTKPGIESGQIDPSQFYSINADGNIIALKYNDFDPILVHADYFLKK